MRKTIKTTILLVVFLMAAFILVAQQQGSGSLVTDFTGTGTSGITQSGDFSVRNGILVSYTGNSANVVIPANLGITEIGTSAFLHWELQTVVIPEGVRIISDRAFNDCYNLQFVIFPNSLTNIGSWAFSGTALRSVVIPAGVIVGDDAFPLSLTRAYSSGNRAAGLYSEANNWAVRDASGIVITGDYVVQSGALLLYLGNDANLVIPSDLRITSIGNIAFTGYGLTSVVIPEGVRSIGERAFVECANLQLVIIPGSIGSIANDAFPSGFSAAHDSYGRTAGVYVRRGSGWWDLLTDDAFDWSSDARGNITINDYSFTGGVALIPSRINRNQVTAIGHWAFGGKQLTGAIFPDGIVSIGNYAFAENRLASIDLGNGLVSIGVGAFTGNQLNSIRLPNSLRTIENNAFSQNRLGSISIPDSVVSVGDGAFSGNSLWSLEIGSSVSSIGAEAFRNNRLTRVVIPGSVTTVGENAFADNQLTSVAIGANVNIGNNAFPSTFVTAYNSGGRVAGTYTVRFAGSWASETTVTAPTSANISPGVPHSGTLAGNTRQWYRVNVPAGRLTIYTEGSLDTQVWVYGDTGIQLAYNDDSGTGRNARVGINVSAGTYYISVAGKTSSDTGSYTLNVFN